MLRISKLLNSNKLVPNCPTCGKHISLKVYPEIGDIVVCEGCGSKAEIAYIDRMEPDYLDVDYRNAEKRGTA